MYTRWGTECIHFRYYHRRMYTHWGCTEILIQKAGSWSQKAGLWTQKMTRNLRIDVFRGDDLDFPSNHKASDFAHSLDRHHCVASVFAHNLLQRICPSL